MSLKKRRAHASPNLQYNGKSDLTVSSLYLYLNESNSTDGFFSLYLLKRGTTPKNEWSIPCMVEDHGVDLNGETGDDAGVEADQ